MPPTLMSGSQGGGPTGTAAPGGIEDITSGTNPLYGFAQRYNPSLLNQVIWDSPWAILPDVFNGINTAGPGYNALRDLGADPLTLYNIIAGSRNDLTGSGVGGYTNWLASLYGSMGQPGGRAFSAQELLNNIFNQGGGDSTTALGRIMASGDAGTQVRTLFNLVREATNAGMNPLAARGYQGAMARAGDTYLNQAIGDRANQGAANQQMHQWLRQNYPGLIPG